ncbi:MAG: 5-formyltetrahydrofolate cyclo-ligase [Phycisphaerae bacterium]|nr:5-formyltetrahydrofolate cyclo-ligase [Phycisphaerae bacterium]
MDKSQLRREVSTRLQRLSEETRAEKSRRISQHLIRNEAFISAHTVMIYLSLAHEVDTTSIILHCWQQQKTVVVPKISWQQRHIIPVQINSLETGITTGASGLRNPTTGIPMPLEDIDLVVAPGLAFDKSGNRLGRGGAYYDRFLASPQLSAAVCSLAFVEQIVEAVPMDGHDKSVDFIVTDEGLIQCA